MKIKLLICLLIFIGLIAFQSCQKDSAKYSEYHEELYFDDNVNQFKYKFMHETKAEKVEQPNLDWQYYGGYYNGTSQMKYRYKHVKK